jgi:hypothetical protein
MKKKGTTFALNVSAIALSWIYANCIAEPQILNDERIEALRALCDQKREDLRDFSVVPTAAQPSQSQMRGVGEKIEWITIHATLSNPREPANNKAAEKDLLDSMEQGSKKIDGNYDGLVKYGSIPYHILVGPSGSVYQGRDFRMQAGSNTVYATPEVWSGENKHDSAGKLRLAPTGQNPGHVAGHLTIALIGTFQPKSQTLIDYPDINPSAITEYKPSKAAEDSLVKVVVGALRATGLTPDRVLLHREIANSTCPGDYAYDLLRGNEKRPGGVGPLMKRIIDTYNLKD